MDNNEQILKEMSEAVTEQMHDLIIELQAKVWEQEDKIMELQTLADNNYASMKYHSDNANGFVKQLRNLEKDYRSKQDEVTTLTGRLNKAALIAVKLKHQLKEAISIAERSYYGWEASDRIKRLQSNELI